MRSTVLLALTVLALAPTAAAAQAPAPVLGPVLRVMTFNIHAGHGDVDRVADVIASLRPDVVALQEVDVHWGPRSDFADQAALLAEATGMEVRFAPIYRLPGATPADLDREYGVALLSRLPVLAWENHLLTRLSTVEEGPPRRMPGLLLATLDAGGHPLHVVSTHLDFRPDPSVRATQVLEMRTLVDAATHPLLLLGDLNAPPDAPELQPLFGALTDTWGTGVEDRDGDGGTPGVGRAPSPGYTYPSDAPTRRIDYVLASPGFRVLRTWVVVTDASDHHPVMAEVELLPG